VETDLKPDMVIRCDGVILYGA